MLREHTPISLTEFNGLWQRGDPEACPKDHFLQADNLQFIQNGFKSRSGLDKYQVALNHLTGILRVYTYVMQSGESLLVLTTGGKIYHVIGSGTTYGPILTIPSMTDFGFQAIAGRAYITPFASSVNSFGVNSEIGLENEFLYVYKGDGTHARKAAGFPPVNGGLKPFLAYPITLSGVVTEGTHVVAVAYFTDQMGLLGPEIFSVVHSPAGGQIQLDNIPVGPVGTTARVVAMTKVIDLMTVNGNVDKTYAWPTNIDGWSNVGPGAINFSYDGTDHAVKFTGSLAADDSTVQDGLSPNTTTWETLGVPVGATVVGVQFKAGKRKSIAITNANPVVLTILAEDALGNNVCGVNPLILATVTGTDAVYTAMAAGGVVAVNSAYAASNTPIRFRMSFSAQAIPSDAATIDVRYDDIVINITYIQQVTALFTGDTSTFTYYDVLTISDNVTTSYKINTADADLVTVHTPSGTPPAAPTSGGLLVQQTDTAGNCDLGFHLIGVVYETDTGFLTAPGPEYFGAQSYLNSTKKIRITGIPTPTDPAVVKRHIVSTKAITNYNGNQNGYQFFFVPDGVINDITTTTLDLSYFDDDLLADASHLIDNFSEIPAFVGLTTYHGRLVGFGEYDNISVARLSAKGEPEAINQVDGLIIAPLDGYPLTNAQEYRDTLYLFKRSKTMAYVDNDDVPSSWQVNVIDQGVGAPVHGIITVLDSGGVNIDFLLIADYSGIMMFNGVYARPELSWKVADLWSSLTKNDFRFIQGVNDSLNKRIWITLPPPLQKQVLYLDYANGLDPQNIRISLWKFSREVQSVSLIDVNKLIIGGDGILYLGDGKNDIYYDKTEAIPNPTWRTAYNPGDNIIHFTAARIRVVGIGNLNLRMYTLDDVRSLDLAPLPMQAENEVIPTRLCNFTTQSASLKGWIEGLDNYFKINRISVYAREVASSYPS